MEDSNAICSIYFLCLPQTSSAGVNFLAQQMQQGQFYFYYPPVSLIVPCFKKLLSIPNVCSLFLIPEWTSAVFWPFIFNGTVYSDKIQAIYPFQPNFFL